MKGIIITIIILYTQLFATVYKVGPGQTYTDLGSVPWLTLTAGDTVLIYWKSTPYASKIFVRVSGTEENPIVIKGVPNSNGELPVITGENATTDPQFAGYFSSEWTEDLGLFLIHRNVNVEPYDDDSYKPKHLIFEYLELTGTKPSNTFTDQFGNTRHYNEFSSAIHALESDNLTIRHCKIHDNAQGIFTNSNGNTEGSISRNTLIEYNEIWGNGNADEDGTEHNVYIQSAGTVIQFNKFGSLRPGSVGANIKDRSAGTIIRYNWIEGSARILDLVETEDAAEIMMNEPNYHDVYVYGNVIINDLKKDPFGVNLIHFGYDNSPVEAKRGTLYFYNNTVFLKGDKEDWWYINLFDIPDDQDTSTTEGTVALYNNIIQREGTTHLQLMRDGGTLTFYENNWVNEDYTPLADGATAQANYVANPILGTDPGFTNTAEEDFTLLDSSPCINQSGNLPAHIVNNYPLDKEYVKHANEKDRPLIGSAYDLGAFESNKIVSVRSDISINNKLELFQNYPNPFNPTTNIVFTLPSDTNVKLIIVNSLGEEITEIINGYKKAGFYKYTFDASGLPSGVYFYRIKADNFSDTKRMVLTK